MSPDQEHRLEEVFSAARNLPPLEQAAFLERACGGDAELRRQADSLLAAHEQAGQFLQPTVALSPASAPFEKPGDRIGRYKLLEQIGEGGFGVVWMAEQREPVQRKVALKIIKAGMDTREVIARFEAERQALALMDHPGIASILDGGATEAGRPYFVMELVNGIPITDYCDQKKLPTADRLQLFMKVCHAVQHAHQKGIIHRDLKPSNVLVTLYDGEPVPKVIDFGVAKALGQKLTQKTLFTAFQHMIGTPAYMSPEQAELSGLDIDTRSDIYSLGVLLYELLTGVTPFDKETLAKAAFDELRRMFRETEPSRPSTRLQTLGEKLTEVAQRRHTEPTALRRLLRGDLDWIVMKCLEKDRQRRYETPDALAMDVARHLGQEPVTAAAPDAFYLAGKFVRRHKAGLATATALTLALVAGLVVSLWQAGVAGQAQRSAEVAQRSAEAARHKEAQMRIRAEQERGRAEGLRATAEDQARQIGRQLYASEMSMGLRTWQGGDVAGALAALERYRPQPGQEDLRGFEWYYLWRLCHSEQLTLTGHSSLVRAVAFSPDGRWLLSGGDDCKARLWDAASGVQAGVLEGHSIGVSAVAFSQDGRTMVTGGRDGTVRLWDARSCRQLTVLGELTNGVGAVTFSPDGRWLAAGSARLVGGSGTPSSRFIDSVVFPAVVKVWDATERKETATLSGHQAGVQALTFAPDGKSLVSASVVGEVILWDLPAGTQRQVLGNFQVPVLALGFSPAGHRLALGGGDLRRRETLLKILDPATGHETAKLQGHRGAVFALAFSPDGETLATAGLDQAIKLWDYVSGREVHELKGHTGPIWSLAFDPTGRRLASASWDKTVKVWAAKQPQAFRMLPGLPGYSVRFSPDGKHLSCGGASVALLEVTSGEPTFSIPGYRNGDTLVAWSPDGHLLAAGGTDQLVTLWEAGSWRKLTVLKGHRTAVTSLAFSPDGRTLASGGVANESKILLWDIAQKRQRLVVQMRSSSIGSLVFTPDGRGLLSGSYREIVCLDPETGREQWCLAEPGHSLALSPDGRLLAADNKNGFSLRLIDLASRQVKQTIRAHNDRIYELAFSADGKTLASASWDGTAKLWNVATGQEIFRYDAPGVAWTVAFSPDGRYWAVGSSGDSQGEVTLFTAATTAEVNAPPGSPRLAPPSAPGFPGPK
jgi:eukaryotic-like serine/threonine-protein kinase